jgi:hypothetical protein
MTKSGKDDITEEEYKELAVLKEDFINNQGSSKDEI